MAIEIIPSGRAPGAEIFGVDLAADPSDGDFGEFRAAWLEHCVVCLRGQRISDERLVRFSRRLGDLERSPASENEAA